MTSSCAVFFIISLLVIEPSFSANLDEKDKLSRDSEWTYTEKDEWPGTCSSGNSQSPIHVSLEYSRVEQGLKTDPVQISAYNETMNGILSNTGKSVMFKPNVTDKVPTITGFGLKGGYSLDHFHFHWGGNEPADRCVGSEHIIEYIPSPLEVHFVHYNSKYEDFTSAQEYDDGLAVVGIQFKPVADDAVVEYDYSTIFSRLAEIKNATNSLEISVDMKKIMPEWSNETVFRYQGSLTTPPCSEIVTWTIYQRRMDIPNKDLEALRSIINGYIRNEAGGIIEGPLINNYRSLQPLNNRDVWTNGEGKGDGSHNSLAPILVMAVLILHFL